MARACFHDQKCEDVKSGQPEEEDEALSLSDLPVKMIDNKDVEPSKEEDKANEDVEEFDFGSLTGSLRTESEMCAADEVFYQGQILPYRHSVSSDTNLGCLKPDIQNPSRSLSRSGSLGGFTSSATSSRSSSIRSHQSSSSSSTSSFTISRTNYKPIRSRNNFITHPSPKPQIKSTSYQHSFGHKNQKSSVWEFFRLSLVRAPDIELQDLKTRTRTNNNNNNASKSNPLTPTKDKKQRFLEKTLMGCKCSVETVPLNVVVQKGSNKNNHVKDIETAIHAEEEKLKELKIKQKKKEGKHEVSRLRTFEWLKELSSHAEQHGESSSSTRLCS